MRTKVFLFPGAWGNDTKERVEWWFQHPVEAIRARDPDAEIIPIPYVGSTLEEVVENILCLLCKDHDRDFRPVALGYSMGRYMFARVCERLEGAPFQAAAYISGVPSYGVPVLGTVDIFRSAPAFLLRCFGGTVMPNSVDEVRRVLCSGQDTELARELLAHMTAEPMWWKIARLFVPGMREPAEPIPSNTPVFATLGTSDLIVGRADYHGDNVVQFNRPDGHHALIRSGRKDLRAIWEQQAEFLLEA